MTKLSRKTSKKNDLLQIVSIKNPNYLKFYADSNAKKTFLILTIFEI